MPSSDRKDTQLLAISSQIRLDFWLPVCCTVSLGKDLVTAYKRTWLAEETTAETQESPYSSKQGEVSYFILSPGSYLFQNFLPPLTDIYREWKYVSLTNSVGGRPLPFHPVSVTHFWGQISGLYTATCCILVLDLSLLCFLQGWWSAPLPESAHLPVVWSRAQWSQRLLRLSLASVGFAVCQIHN